MNMLATIDLGGTHCRFARFTVTAWGLVLDAVETCPTARLQDSVALLERWESCLHTPLSQVAALVMGVAGPVQDGLRARLSNAPLRIDLKAVMPQFGLRRARVVNDFVCEACACLTRVGERSRHLLGPADMPCPSRRSPGEALAPVAVLGAGTGLGSGWLVPQADSGQLRWLPLPSEAGHQAFAFLGREEEDFAAFARERLERPFLRPDDVVTGRGLVVLHRQKGWWGTSRPCAGMPVSWGGPVRTGGWPRCATAACSLPAVCCCATPLSRSIRLLRKVFLWLRSWACWSASLFAGIRTPTVDCGARPGWQGIWRWRVPRTDEAVS